MTKTVSYQVKTYLLSQPIGYTFTNDQISSVLKLDQAVVGAFTSSLLKNGHLTLDSAGNPYKNRTFVLANNIEPVKVNKNAPVRKKLDTSKSWPKVAEELGMMRVGHTPTVLSEALTELAIKVAELERTASRPLTGYSNDDLVAELQRRIK
jgi:hypothetical protein